MTGRRATVARTIPVIAVASAVIATTAVVVPDGAHRYARIAATRAVTIAIVVIAVPRIDDRRRGLLSVVSVAARTVAHVSVARVVVAASQG
jgi:hypothetical protein